MKKGVGSLLVFLFICYGSAFIASLVTRPEIPAWYATLAKPAWRPPNWLFAPVWTILYGMMAVAGWRVWRCEPSRKRTVALWIFGLQLTLNFLWSPVFFHFHRIGNATVIISLLAASLIAFIATSWKLDRTASALFVPYLLWVSFACLLNYTIWEMNPARASHSNELPTAYALLLQGKIDPEDFPATEWWEKAPPIRFASDWKGQNTDPLRETEVRLLWTQDTLYLRFLARYRELTVFPDARPDGWRDGLWDRDVAEVFLQPDASDPLVYKELEVSPNGQWIDLNISHGQKEEMRSGLRRRVVQDAQLHTWTAELAVPMSALAERLSSKQRWRVNFYRVEGKTEPRFYAAWSPTMTPQPNFHVPEAFGYLEFRD